MTSENYLKEQTKKKSLIEKLKTNLNEVTEEVLVNMKEKINDVKLERKKMVMKVINNDPMEKLQLFTDRHESPCNAYSNANFRSRSNVSINSKNILDQSNKPVTMSMHMVHLVKGIQGFKEKGLIDIDKLAPSIRSAHQKQMSFNRQ